MHKFFETRAAGKNPKPPRPTGVEAPTPMDQLGNRCRVRKDEDEKIGGKEVTESDEN